MTRGRVCVAKISSTLKRTGISESTIGIVITKKGYISRNSVRTLKEDDLFPFSGKGEQEVCTNNRGKEYLRRKSTYSFVVVFFLTETGSHIVTSYGDIGVTI